MTVWLVNAESGHVLPSKSMDDPIDGLSTNSILLPNSRIAHRFSRLSNYGNVGFRKYGVTVFASFVRLWFPKSGFVGMKRITRMCTPFQIINAIILSIPVNMIDLIHTVRLGNKGQCDKPVNPLKRYFATLRQDQLVVTIPGDELSYLPRHKSSGGANSFHTPKRGNFIGSFISDDGFPFFNFKHDFLHETVNSSELYNRVYSLGRVI